MKIIAVVTARAGSVRLKNKNILPLAGRPLAEWSVIAAVRAGLRCIVTSDIPELAAVATRHGATFVERPQELATSDCSHAEAVLHALEGERYDAVMLLQPTSPFRTAGIVRKCVEMATANPGRTLPTTGDHHGAILDGGDLVRTHQLRLWDGCVCVSPKGDELGYTDCYGVRNAHMNTLQIDTPEEYAEALSISTYIHPLSGSL